MTEQGRKMLERVAELFREPEWGKRGTECCVVCHKLMDIPKNMPVDQRQNYYEGAGQICDECWNTIYGGSTN